MKHIEIRRNTHKKLGTLGLLSLAALAQFGIAPQGAQAATWSDDTSRDDNFIQVQARRRAQRLTVRGTVTNDGSGDVFTMRTDSGRTIRVYSRYDEPARLNRGDYVEVIGYLDGNDNRFTADSVRILRNNGNNNNSGYNTTIRGRVEDDQRGPNAFVIRANDGRAYLVDTRNANRPNLDRGDVVEVRGRISGTAIFANNVRVISGNGGGIGDNVLTGRVSRDYAGREFEVVGDNGRSYTVRSRRAEPIRLTRGDRVQVRGEMRNGIFHADSVRIIRNDDENGYGSRVNFTGVVQRDGSRNRFTVRADNGRTYVVTNSNVEVNAGERVRVVGFLNNGIVRAERVDVRGSFNDDDFNNGRTVRLEGRVREVGRGYLVVRDSDDNVDRTVRTNDANDFRSGDRVIVTGRMRGNEIIASGIRRD